MLNWRRNVATKARTCSNCKGVIQPSETYLRCVETPNLISHMGCVEPARHGFKEDDYCELIEGNYYLSGGKWTCNGQVVSKRDYFGPIMSTHALRFNRLKLDGYDMNWDASACGRGQVTMWGTNGKGQKKKLVVRKVNLVDIVEDPDDEAYEFMASLQQ